MEKREQRKKRAVALVCLGLFVAFSLAVCWFVGKPMLQFVSQPEQFRAWVDSHGFWGRLAFLGMVAFQVIIAIVPGEPLEIGAGYAFGAVEGTLLCILGTTLEQCPHFLGGEEIRHGGWSPCLSPRKRYAPLHSCKTPGG